MKVFAALAVAVLLAGCSASDGHDTHATDAVPKQTTAIPSDQSPEAGFVRDMSVHHAQAVAMAEAIRARTDDPELRLMSTDIALGQQNQIGRMTGWLDQWGLSVSADIEPMAWMTDHEAMATATSGTAVSGLMPGMATRPQVSALSTLPINEAEISFLQLMIVHHRAGVRMAEAIVSLTERPEVLMLATSIISGQQGEITIMTDMLAKRGAKP